MITFALIALATATPPVPRNSPSLWITQSPESIGTGERGQVGVALTVDPAGRVTGCRVMTGSGFPGLDRMTCIQATRRGRFVPARSNDGTAVAGTYSMTVTYGPDGTALVVTSLI